MSLRFPSKRRLSRLEHRRQELGQLGLRQDGRVDQHDPGDLGMVRPTTSSTCHHGQAGDEHAVAPRRQLA